MLSGSTKVTKQKAALLWVTKEHSEVYYCLIYY
jgi:hypothetical protein